MDIIYIIALIVILFVVVMLYLKLQATNKLLSEHKNNEGMVQLQSLLNSQQQSISTLNQQSLDSMKNEEMIAERLRNMNENVLSLLKESTTSSQKVNGIADRVNALNDIMVNKKSRGNWGEYQLNNLLSVYAGDNQEIYEVQYSLKNGYIGDVALHLPGTDKVMIIDSKFPLENYQNLLNKDLSDVEISKYEGLFKQNIKKHINDIAKKYINSQTVENAVMFIPSEAIYMYVCGNHSELIEEAHKKHILITSPTTLIGVVFTLVNLTKDFKRSRNIKALEKDIVGMYQDVERLYTRLDKVDNTISNLQKNFKDVRTSSEKIGGRIVKIHDGYNPEDNETDA